MVLVHVRLERITALHARLLRRPKIAHLINAVATIYLRGHSNGLSSRRHISIVIILLDIPTRIVLHTLLVTSHASRPTIEAQLVLVFLHPEVDSALLQLCQTLALIEGVLDLVDHIIVAHVGLALVVILVPHIGQVLYVRLELLEENETEGDQGLRLDILQVLGLLHRVDVQEDVILLLK